MSKLRALAIRCAGCLAALLMLSAIAFIVMKTPYFDEFLKAKLVAAAEAQGVALSLEAFDFDPVGPRVSATGITVNGPDGSWQAQCASLQAELHLLRSLTGPWLLSLRADTPRVSGTILPLEPESAPVSAPGPPGIKLPNVSFLQLQVDKGTVDLAFPALEGALRLGMVQFDWDERGGRGAIGPGTFRWRGGEESFHGASVEGERSFGIVRFKRFSLETDRISLDGEASVGFAQMIDGTFRLKVDARELPVPWLEALHLDRVLPIGLLLEMEGELDGTVGDPIAKGDLMLSQGRFGPMTLQSLTSYIRLEAEELRFRNLAARTGSGRVSDMTGSLTWDDGLWVDARLNVDDYNLRKSMSLLTRGVHFFPVGAFASGRVEARGELYPELSLENRVDVDVEQMDVSSRINGEVRTWYGLERGHLTQTSVVERDGITFGKGMITSESVDVEIKSGRIDYHIGLEYETEVTFRNLSSVRGYLPESFDAAGRVEGRFGGPYRELEFHYDIDLEKAEVFGEPLGRVRGRADYDLRTLRLRDMEVEGPQGRFGLDGKVGLHRGGSYDLALEWTEGELAMVAGFVERFLPPAPLTLAGVVGAKGRVRGDLLSPVFRGEILMEDIQTGPWKGLRGVQVQRLEARGDFGAEGMVLDQFLARAYEADWIASGYAEGDAMELIAKVEALELEQLEQLVELPAPVIGVASSRLHLRGGYDDLRGIATGEVDGLEFRGGRVGDVTYEVGLSPGRLEPTVHIARDRVRASGRIELAGEFFVGVEVNALPWSALPEGLVSAQLRAETIDGRGEVSGRLGDGGRIDALSWEGVLDGVRVLDESLGPVTVGVSYPVEGEDEETVAVEAGLWEGMLKQRALVPFDLQNPRVSLKAERLELARFARWVPVEGGSLNASAEVAFDRVADKLAARSADPDGVVDLDFLLGLARSASMHGRVSDLAADVPYPLPADITFSLKTQPDVWLLEAGSETIDVTSARLDPHDHSWEAEVSLKELEPLAFVEKIPKGLTAKIDGTLRFTGQGERFERVSGAGAFHNVVYPPTQPLSGTWALDGDGERFEADLLATEKISAHIIWERATGWTIQCEADSAPLEGWIDEERWPANLTGRLTGSGVFRRDSEGETFAEATITGLQIIWPPARVESLGDLEFSYVDGELFLESVGVSGEGFDMGIMGRLRPGERWDVRLRGTGDMTVLGRGLSHVETSAGDVYAELSIVGDWKSPSITGELEVQEGARVKFRQLAYPLEQISMHATLEGGKGINVDSFKARMGRGTLNVEGGWMLDGFTPGQMRFFAELKDMHYEYPLGASYDFDGEFLLTGDLESPQFRGEVQLKRFLYNQRLLLGTKALAAMQRRPREIAPTGDEQRGSVYVDVAVLGDRNLRVENNVAKLDLESDLRIRGYFPNPEILGSMAALSGTVTYRGLDYDVMRSSVDFLGEAGAAVLDARATTKVSSYLVNVEVTGPFDDLLVELSSVPSLPRTDIIALLTVRTTSDDLGESDNLGTLEATNFLTGGIQDELEAQMSDVFGIDQFHIDPVYSSSTQTTVPRATMGKQLSESIYGRYGVLMGGEAEHEVSLEYTLSPAVQLLGSWTDTPDEDRGSVGGEIRFRYTFR